jgi:GT2 family glycosyltransferase
MPRPPVSVIVPSFGRPGDLDRCLTGLGQILYRPYEVVVVACAPGRAAVARHLGKPFIRAVPNEGTGVAAARNRGLAEARGEIVAFIDDDAVPEPTWLDHLVAAMEETGAAAATGFVRGRNGISYQWRGRRLRRDGYIDPLPDRGEAPWRPEPAGGALMLEGTNMAVRRDALIGLGGFDPVYRFYLDDADLALRLSDAGLDAVLVPLAQVHHAFAASPLRRPDRMPRDLYDVGRSLAIFLQSRLGPGEAPSALAAHREDQRRRVIRYMVSGHGEPRDPGRLLSRFDESVRDGMEVRAAGSRAIAAPEGRAAFRDGGAPAVRVMAGRSWSRGTLRRAAAEAAARGELVSLFRFSPTTLYHRVRFDPAGFWEQTGGVFGRSDRADPLFRAGSFRHRLEREVSRVAKVRGIRETRP